MATIRPGGSEPRTSAPPSSDGPISPALSAAGLVAALAGLAGGFLAAGSTGLLAHPLRHALTWIAMGIALVAAWPPRGQRWPQIAALLGGLAAAVLMTASPSQPINAMAVAVFLAALASVQSGTVRHSLVLVAAAVGILGVYRFALTSIALLWLGADTLGEILGRFAGALSGQPLRVGATFGGLDFLAAMGAFYACWLASTPPPRRRRALYALLAILAGHLVYLIALSFGAFLRDLFPEPPPPRSYHFATDPSTWSVALAVRTLVPWNFQALAAAIDLLIAGGMLRWAPSGAPANEPKAGEAEGPLPIRHSSSTMGHWSPGHGLLAVGAGIIALVLPIVATLSTGKADLSGKKVVAYKEGFLNWLKAENGEYGRLSIGMYGMLKSFVPSLGGTFVISPDLSEEDLADADIVLLLYPNKPWTDAQLERIWNVARRGGAIFLFSDHTIREADGENRANDVLAKTHLRIRFDTAEFEVGGWLHSYEAMAHPTTAGFRDDRNQFGVVIGASLECHWPARPLLMARWGWNDLGDPGSAAALLGNRRYDAGERLGDQVLAGEDSLGEGRVIAFSDTSSITNGINMGAHPFVSRLFAYLAGGLSNPQAAWREIIGLIAACTLVALLGFKPQPGRVALAALLLSASLAVCTARTYRAAETLPDGRPAKPLPEGEAAKIPPDGLPAKTLPDGRQTVALPDGRAADVLPDGRVSVTLADGRVVVSNHPAYVDPDGRMVEINNLAYIDTTHLANVTDESERDNGVLGLKLTLMRNGYLTLDLPEFTAERLERAGLLISVAPSRKFSRAERQIVYGFVKNGGVLISTVGWEDERPSRSLLAEFGLYLGYSPSLSEASASAEMAQKEYFCPPGGAVGATDDPNYAPQPLGHFKSPYLNRGDNKAPDLCFVRFHAAWPVASMEPPENFHLPGAQPAKPLAYGHMGPAKGGVDVPVIIERRVGAGRVILVGDTAFAMNKNLENMDGQPFEGMRENADFWRWLITYLTKPQGQWWIPPKAEPKAGAGQPVTPPE